MKELIASVVFIPDMSENVGIVLARVEKSENWK
jgi:hypothetical protein